MVRYFLLYSFLRYSWSFRNLNVWLRLLNFFIKNDYIIITWLLPTSFPRRRGNSSKFAVNAKVFVTAGKACCYFDALCLQHTVKPKKVRNYYKSDQCIYSIDIFFMCISILTGLCFFWGHIYILDWCMKK